MERKDTRVAGWLALLLLGVYLLVFSGRIYSSDGLSMFAVTESVIKRGETATDQMWTFFGSKTAPAPDGEVYSKYGYGTSLLAAPLFALAWALPFVGLMQMTMLASTLAVAVAGALVYLAARRLSFGRTVSVIVTLLFGVATPAFVYAKEFWSESFAMGALLGAFYFLLCYRTSRRSRDAVIAGIALGLAIAIRTTNVLLVPLYAWYAFVPLASAAAAQPQKGGSKRRGNSRASGERGAPLGKWQPVILFLAPIAVSLIGIVLYNFVRFGNPLTTGYRADETFSNPILLGAYGLLFSPGKGLLIYAPFLAALPFGVWQFYKRARRELIFMGALFGITLALFSAWYYWWGGTNWGARFLVPTLPFLVLLCAPLVEVVVSPPPDTNRVSHAVLVVVFGALVLVSIVNEVAGVSISSLTYRLRTLNASPNPDADAIFVPEYSPLIGYWSRFKPMNLDFAWVRATADAVQVDWLVVGLTTAFIVVCAVMLVRTLREDAPTTNARAGVRRSWLVRLGLVAALLAIFSMARYADDPRFEAGASYRQVVQQLAQEGQDGDVLILNDDAHATELLNENRTRMKWYGLSRDPARWDAATMALVERLGKTHARVWFAYDEQVDAPNPMSDWMQTHFKTAEIHSFPNTVHLRLMLPQ